jgi:hypothetical protein
MNEKTAFISNRFKTDEIVTGNARRQTKTQSMQIKTWNTLTHRAQQVGRNCADAARH